MTVNGKKVNLKEAITLSDFLEQNAYQTERIAVERNGDIIPKSAYQHTLLSDEDKIEIVHFVGGG